jgi:hypothetical protein
MEREERTEENYIEIERNYKALVLTYAKFADGHEAAFVGYGTAHGYLEQRRQDYLEANKAFHGEIVASLPINATFSPDTDRETVERGLAEAAQAFLQRAGHLLDGEAQRALRGAHRELEVYGSSYSALAFHNPPVPMERDGNLVHKIQQAFEEENVYAIWQMMRAEAAPYMRKVEVSGELYDDGLGNHDHVKFRGELPGANGQGVPIEGELLRTQYGVTIDQMKGRVRLGDQELSEFGGTFYLTSTGPSSPQPSPKEADPGIEVEG